LNLEYDLKRDLYTQFNIQTVSTFTHALALKKMYNKVKPDWVRTNNGTATQEAFADLQKSVQRYWDIRTGKITTDSKKSRRDGRVTGWLRWRNRRQHNGFRATNTTIKLDGKHVRYNKTVGDIHMCEALRFDGKIMNGTFSWDGQWFWVSIQVKMDTPDLPRLNGSVGVDLGINYLVVTSDGQFKKNPKSYYAHQANLARLQRMIDRQRRANNPDNYNEDGTAKKGRREWAMSNRMKQTDQAIKRLHHKIRNTRRDAQHQLTADIAANYGFIVVEDLNVRRMLKNRRLAKAIADAGFHEIKRQLTYKTEPTHGIIQVVDRWFPSSKLCSGCGYKNLDLKLSDRSWECPDCGQENERDLNAAINLKNEGIRIFGKNGHV